MRNALLLDKDKRNHKHQYKIGTLLRSDGTDSFDKYGFCIVMEHLQKSINTGFSGDTHYLLFSQEKSSYLEIPCWVVNGFYHKVNR